MLDDSDAIRARVREALREAGAEPWLIAYDANGIQELVTGSGRPIAMGGASRVITAFDTQARTSMTIFAGGGRGMLLARSRAEAEKTAADLRAEFRRCTKIGVMATAFVPLELRQEQLSLRWLRQKLEIEKDAAPPVGGELPTGKDDECEDCHSYHAQHPVPREQGTTWVCERCHAMRENGKGTGELSESIVDIADPGSRRVAAVSADGNSLGAFFESLHSLEAQAAASHAVQAIFQNAHKKALSTIPGKVLRLITGGDDVRAFIPVSGLVSYIETLAREVEAGAASAGSLGGLLNKQSTAALRQLGIGIGAVVADSHYPAWRLMAYAHELEVHAKQRCCAAAGTAGYRSALDLAVITNEDSMAASIDSTRTKKDSRPFSLAADVWQQARDRAEALAKVPTAQLALVAQKPTVSDEEHMNLFRYQVARSTPWQAWYRACGLEWRQPEVLRDNRPDPGLLTLRSVLQ